MAISFPTGHAHPSLSHGTPRRASPCQCVSPLIDADTLRCLGCGKLEKRTINDTFAERARVISMRAQARKMRRVA